MEPYSEYLTQCKKYFLQAFRFIALHRKKITLGLLVCLVPVGVFFSKEYLQNFLVENFTTKTTEITTTIEVPAISLEERFAELQTKLQELEEKSRQQVLQSSALKESFELAITEVAAQNDVLVKQAEKLESALAKASLPTGKVSNDVSTKAPASQKQLINIKYGNIR